MSCSDNLQTGDFVLLSLDGNVIVSQISSDLSSSFDLIDAGTKCDPVNPYALPGLRSSSFSIDGNVPTGDAGYEVLQTKHFTPTLADALWGPIGGNNYSGEVWLNDITLNAPKNDMASFSATATIDGPITPIAI